MNVFFRESWPVYLILPFLCFACGQRPAAVNSISADVEVPDYKKFKDINDYFKAPLLDIPDPTPIPGWKKETRVKAIEFQLPETFQPRFRTSFEADAVPPSKSGSQIKSSRNGYIFIVDDLRVNLSVWSNIQPEELIKRNNIYETTLIDVRRVTKPRRGFYFKYTAFGDYIFELLLEVKADTYQFRVIRPQGGTQKKSSSAKISDDELLKILYSLKLPAQ